DPEVSPVLTVDEAFAPVMEAVRRRHEIRFSYLGKADDVAAKRRLQPWGVACFRGKWYVVGHDVSREATRCFRLSRISGAVTAHGAPDAYSVPENLNLLEHVASLDADAVEVAPRRATVRV